MPSVYSPNRSFLFVHIPKCAGSSIHHALGTVPDSRFVTTPHDIAMGHSTSKNLRALLGKEAWDNCFKFTFVRNPYDWLVSLYFHVRQNVQDKHIRYWKPAQKEVTKQIKSLSFKDYVRYQADMAGTVEQYDQHSYILGGKGAMLIDFLGRFETISSDWSLITSRIGIPTKLPYKNKSTHKHCSDYYDDSTQEIAYNYLKKDFELFGYRKDF